MGAYFALRALPSYQDHRKINNYFPTEEKPASFTCRPIRTSIAICEPLNLKECFTQRKNLQNRPIADEQLAIISSFRTQAPLGNAGSAGPYNQSAVEDVAGPLSHVPISRHKGESFKLPSKITTVAGICRKFDENIYKYYVFPGKTFATRLVNSLINIAEVEETDDVPKLYFGEILSSFNAGKTPKPTNLRMTELRCHKNIKDFYLKAIDSEQTEKGIGDQSKGAYRSILGKNHLEWHWVMHRAAEVG